VIRTQTRDGLELVEVVLGVLRNRRARQPDRLAAATWLGDRAFGKPAQALELSGPEGERLFPHPDDLIALPDPHLKRLITVIRDVHGDGADNGGPTR
jgi:hypothetical protein